MRHFRLKNEISKIRCQNRGIPARRDDFRNFALCILIFAFLPLTAHACSTPVFRYALERWPADFYDGVLLHRGAIADDHPAALLFQDETAEFLNLRLSKMDLESATDEEVKGLLGDHVPEKLPALALWYPWQKGRAAPFWTGEFTPETVAVLMQSPTRKEVARRLTEGQAGVWVFVESGNPAKDKAALELLKKELKTVTEELTEMAPPVEESDTPGLSFEFSTISLSRTDPNERVLLSMFMNSEPDLDEYVNEPMAIPVFGRGRALYTLIGEGINADNIREAAAFLTGPCGCEIKMMNPGVDLLMAVNWDGAVMQFYEEFYATEEEELPELTSVFPDEPGPAQPQLNAAAQMTENDSGGAPTGAGEALLQEMQVEVQVGKQQRGFGLMGTAAVSLGGLMLAVVLGTLAVSRKKK